MLGPWGLEWERSMGGGGASMGAEANLDLIPTSPRPGGQEMLCSTGPGIWRCSAAPNASLQSIAIQLPLSARIGPSGRSLSLNMKWLLFQLPQLSQRSLKSWVRCPHTAHS